MPGGALFASRRLIEADLADRLNMSRTPVREALHRLALIGILEAAPGGGYVPRRFTRREIRDQYELRILLEPLAAESAAALSDDVRLPALVDATDLVTNEVSAEANTRFHKAIGHLGGNRSLARIIDQAVDRLSREGVHARGSTQDQGRLAEGHDTVVQAIRLGDGPGAAMAMQGHLRLALDILMLSMRGGQAHERSSPAAADVGDASPRERLGEGAYVELRSAILGGRLAPGAILSETSVATALSVSRTPTRYALRRLEAEGYIDRDERGRLSVHRLSRQELAELFAVRRAVEAEASRRAAHHVSLEELEQLDEYLSADLVALRSGDVEALERLNEQIHAAVLRASRSRSLVLVAGDVRERVYGFGFSAFALGGRAERRKFVEEHAAMVRAIHDGDGDAAAGIVGDHLARAGDLLQADFDRYDARAAL
jgi:DNA-binding GntR family transcriptional regulator